RPEVPEDLPSEGVPSRPVAAMPEESLAPPVVHEPILPAERPEAAPAAEILPSTVPELSPGRPAVPWWAWLVIAYLAGVGLCLVRLVLGCLAVARLRSSGGPVDDPAWCDALASWRQRTGVRRHVALRWSPLIRVPMTVGWLRPVILLPESWTCPIELSHRDAVL